MAIEKPPPKSAAKPVASGRVTLSKGKAKAGISFKSQQAAAAAVAGMPAPEDPGAKFAIEDRVFAIPGLKDVEPPPIFVDFMEKIAPRIQLGQTGYLVLEAFSNIDVTAEKVCQIIKGNPYYEGLFQKVIEAMAKREEMPSLEGSVVLLGMQNFRNLIMALSMSRAVAGRHPEWDKDGKLQLSPNDMLKYALKTEEPLVASKNEFSDTAYAAGMIYDLLVHVSSELCEDKKKIHAYIDSVYGHGLRTAHVAMGLAKLIPDFGFKKYVFSAGLIHDVGKILIAILNPEYITFAEECRKKEWPRPIRQYVEREKFGINHTVLGGIFFHYYKMFRPIDKVIQFHHEPYLLKTRNRNLYQLAALLSLSTNIASNFKKTDKLDDPVVALWRGVELKDFKIDMRAVLNAVSTSIQI